MLWSIRYSITQVSISVLTTTCWVTFHVKPSSKVLIDKAGLTNFKIYLLTGLKSLVVIASLNVALKMIFFLVVFTQVYFHKLIFKEIISQYKTFKTKKKQQTS